MSFVDPEFGVLGEVGAPIAKLPGLEALGAKISETGGDQENPQNMAYGEYWAYQTVRAVLESPAWPRTLLLYTYDEHGGYYDHVPPPAAIAPDSIAPALGPEDVPGGYDIYGPRVPAIVASPYAKPNGVTNVVHDHTSVLATIEAKWNLPALTYRDANARTVEDFLDLSRAAYLEPPVSSVVEPPGPGRNGGGQMRRAATAALTVLVCCLTAAAAAQAARTKPFKLPKVKHVFVIVLENKGWEKTFGDPEADPYLARTLPAQGALLENYYATGHESNDNYISLVSGQPPNVQNQADCQLFSDWAGAAMLPSGVEAGTGCVYPAEVQTIGNQLTSAGKKWKAYMQDMGNDPNREAAACGHPALNSSDETQKAEPGDGYATRHDPFVYFHSVIDEPPLLRRPRRRAGVALGRDAGRGAQGRDGARNRPLPGGPHAGVLVHHAEPVRRRPRLPVHEPAVRRIGARRHRRLPGNLDPEDRVLERLPPRRPDRGRLRRVRRSGIRLLVLLRGGTRSGLAAAGHQRPRRRARRRGADLALHRAGDGREHRLQPLLLARELGAAVRAAGARGRGERAALRPGRVHGGRVAPGAAVGA